MRADFGEAVEDPPGDVQPGGDLRQCGGDRRSDDSGEAVEDLEQRRRLREDERLLDGGVDGFVAGPPESRDGDVEHLEPPEEERPVVEDEVESPRGGGYSGHIEGFVSVFPFGWEISKLGLLNVTNLDMPRFNRGFIFI